jgi:hypothetical protein
MNKKAVTRRELPEARFPPRVIDSLSIGSQDPWGERVSEKSTLLFAKVELLEDCLVTLGSGIFQVVKKTAARGNHLEKAAT